MAAFFFDTSALVKRYVTETGSDWVNQLFDPAAENHVYAARITGVELASAVARRRRGGSLTAEAAASLLERFRDDFGNDFLIVELTSTVVDNAMRLAESHELRAYDAIQLSAALDLHGRRLASGHSALTLVSSDMELNAVASSFGLSVEDPNLHP